jgi:hypothetical protein
MCFGTDCRKRFLVGLQAFHVLGVRHVDRLVKRISRREVPEHSRHERTPREVICPVSGVSPRTVRFLGSRVQQSRVDEHRGTFQRSVPA